MGIFGPRPLGLARGLRAPRRARARSLTSDPDSWQASPAKKARVGQDEPAKPPSSPLSEEQLVRIQRNKAAALLRLAARNVPAGFGESWKQHLSGEFGKPYFVKVGGRAGAACVCGWLSFGLLVFGLKQGLEGGFLAWYFYGEEYCAGQFGESPFHVHLGLNSGWRAWRQLPSWPHVSHLVGAPENPGVVNPQPD